MARMTNKGISGLVGTVVLYTMNGKDYIRSRPRKRKKKRGEAQRPENAVFAAVSRYGTRLVKSMAGSFLFSFKLTTYNTMRGWMSNQFAAHKDDTVWQLSAKRNVMCQLNPEADFRDFLAADITVSDDGSGIISVNMPAMIPVQDLRAPLRTKKVNVKIIAAAVAFGEPVRALNSYIEQYDLNYSSDPVPSKNILLDTKAATGDIAIVAIAFEFETTASGNNVYNNDQQWLPAAVVAMGRLG